MAHGPTYVDFSARPIVRLAGPEALDLMQRISTNDVRSLAVGSAVGTILTTDKGRIRDVLSLVRLAETELLLFGTLSERKDLAAWIERFVIMEDIKVQDATDEFFRYQLLWPTRAMQGGEGGSLQSLASVFGGGGRTWLMADPATGGKTVSLIGDKHLAGVVKLHLEREGFRRGDDESLRNFCVYYGLPVPGLELSIDYNPHEVGLLPLVSFTKGCYVGQEVIARLDTYKKVQRRLVSFELSEKPAELPARLAIGSEETGILSSVVYSDELASWIGIGFVKPAFLEGAECASYRGERAEGVARLRKV